MSAEDDMLARSAPPEINEVDVWMGLPPDVQLTIGGLVIREAFHRFAAETFVGETVYLDAAGRQASDEVADQAAQLVRERIQAVQPDLFGESGTDDNPDAWTDPAWARPFQIEPAAVVAVISDEAADRALMKAQRKARAANRRADEAERQLAFVRRALDLTRKELAEARMRTGVHVQDAHAREARP